MLRLETHASLAGHAPAWDALVDLAPRPSPFLCSWWVDAAVGGTPAFVLAFDGSQLVGGLPLSVDRGRGVARVRIVSAGNPHDLDVVARPERADEVAGAVVGWLTRTGNRIVDLRGLAQDGALVRHAPTGARIERQESAPWMDLPSTFEAYLASRKKKLRQDIRRVIRRLEEKGVEWRIARPGDTDQSLATLHRLHALRWKDESEFLASFDEFARAARAGAARGELRFHEAFVGDCVIASTVTIERAGTCFCHQIGRDPSRDWSGSGTFIKARAIDWACSSGLRRLDLCFGEHPGKAEWVDELRPVVSARWAEGLLGRPLNRALRAVAPAVDVVRRRRSAG